MSKNCLNCGKAVHGKYCSNCAQKSETQRITPKHFVAHDLVHGMFHIEKGLFFTILQIAKRGGNTAKEYIAGKRVRYYNVFYLSLILLGFNILLSFFQKSIKPESAMQITGTAVTFVDYLARHVKLIVLTLIPLLAMNTWLVFRKNKYNFAEHMVAAGFCMVGCLSFETLSNLINLLDFYNSDFFASVNLVAVAVLFVIPLLFYYGLVRPTVSRWGYAWRILVFYILLFVELLALLLVLVYLSTGGFSFEGELVM
jgi:hypothetical protein